MQGTNEDAMDINGSPGNNIIINGQTSPSNEQSEKLNLLEMLREILEHILVNLDDKSMLRASHVCTLFASVIKTAFARKYSNRYYNISERNKSYQKVMLTKYGGLMRSINVNKADEEILDLIEEKCCSLENAKLATVPKVIQLKNLKRLSLEEIEKLDREVFTQLISHNQQLESLELGDNASNLIELLDRLNSLRIFKYDRDTQLTANLSKIRLNSLEILKLEPFREELYVRLLQALECKRLKQLDLECYNGLEDSNKVINAIGKFKRLAVLRLPVWQVTLEQLKKLATRLPSLTGLSISTAKKEPNSIENYVSSVLSIFPKLLKTKIRLVDKGDFDQFANDVKKSIIEFHGRFHGTKSEIGIVYGGGQVFTSRNFAFVKSESLELHWMANLNVKNVRKAMHEVLCYTSNLKFVNHCAEHAVDICAFLPKLEHLKCLDIQSDGPITFKANSSRHHKFFPKLKILKIYGDERNAIDFLGKLDGIFCERIQELWLDTRSGALQDQELDHTHDMTNIFAKFKNLTSLNLVPAFAYFNPKHVLSVCKDLSGLHIRR